MADRKLDLRVISPRSATDKRPYKLQKESDLVIMRCISGDLGVLVGRMPCTMVLGSGVLRFVNDGKEYHMAVIGGVAHVSNDVVTVLTDTALFPNEIDGAEVSAKIGELQSKIDAESDMETKSRLKSSLHDLQVQLEVAGK